MQPSPPPEHPPPPPPPPGGVPGGGGQPSNGLGLAAMIIGIVSIPLICCFYIGVAGGVVAAVLGFLGKAKAERGEATNRGQALAGIILGIIAAVLGLVLLILAVVLNAIDFSTWLDVEGM